MYVQALLDVHNKYAAMVESSFTGDSGFLQSLDKVGVLCVGVPVCVVGVGGTVCGVHVCVLVDGSVCFVGLLCGESS